jgi:hypothetical protein
MNYCQAYLPSLDETIAAAWEFQVAAAAETPSLADTLATQASNLFPRFAARYAELRALPRGARRTLQRRLARSGEPPLPTEWRHKLAGSLAGAALMLALVQDAQAATITVTTDVPTINAADGLCSLVEAIINANDDAATHPDCVAGTGIDIVVLPTDSTHKVTNNYGAGLYGPTRLPPITSQITIEGNGSRITRRKSNSIARLVAVTSSGDLTLNNVTVRNGLHPYGAALFNDGVLAVTNSTLSGNRAIVGAGIYNSTNGTAIVSNSIISGNRAAYGGAGIFNSRGNVTIQYSSIEKNTGYYGGGLYNDYGTASITHSTISNNRAFGGGGIRYHGGEISIDSSTVSKNRDVARGGGISGEANFSSGGTLTIANSTISKNVTSSSGGGISLSSGNFASVHIENSTISGNKAGYSGGGIANFNVPTLTIENSTISGNSAGRIGGGIWHQGNGTLTNITISGNIADKRGGGIYNNSSHGLTLSRSLISGNQAAAGREIFNPNGGVIFSDNFNLFGADGKGGVKNFTPGPSDIVPPAGMLLSNVLSPLADNGGPTLTRALVSGSPAIDAVPLADPACAGTDQRGVSRPQGGGCDIGAFERE